MAAPDRSNDPRLHLRATGRWLLATTLPFALALLAACGTDPVAPANPPGTGGGGGGGNGGGGGGGATIPTACERPDAIGFQPDTARLLADLAERAYEIDGLWQPGTVVSTRSDCWELVEFVERIDSSQSVDTQLSVARNRYTNDLVVAFRGSKEGTDVWTDLSYSPVDWTLDNGVVVPESVHGGFARAYFAVRQRLLDLLLPHLAAQAGERPRIYFTGHSLGGALATLAALDLAEPLVRGGADRGDLILYTFGAPRSTTIRLRNALLSAVPNAYALAIHKDWITHLPESILAGNEWVHLPQMALLHGESGRARAELGDGAAYDGCLGVPIPLSLAHHGIALYQQRLDELITTGDPAVNLTLSGDGNLVLNWSADLPGPCDWVGLFRGVPRDPDDHLGLFSWEWATKASSYKTWWAKGDDYYGAYVNGFDAIVTRSQPYVPTTPRVWMSRYDGILGDWIQLNWSVSDPGENDFVALYDEPPLSAGTDGYLTLQWGWAINGSSEVTNTLWRSGYYVAYVMEDDDGRRRILAWAGPN